MTLGVKSCPLFTQTYGPNKGGLISALQHEVHILLHLAGKVDKSQQDYRPTAKQRSTLELLRYMAIMGPTQLAVIKTGVFDRPR